MEALRSSRERVLLQKLQHKISLAPPVDRHPPAKLGDILPQWYEKNVAKSANVLASASETLQAALPGKLLKAITIGPLQRGHLTLFCSSSAAKMELDMALRNTLLRQLQTATNGLIFKVKTMVNREYSKG
jgi:hypothetical protein